MGAPFRFEDIPDDARKLARDCDISFFRASGPGGQHRNTTDTAVRIVHVPTGVTAIAAEERSQARNREAAFVRLRKKLIRKLKPRTPRRETRVPGREKEDRRRDKLRRAAKKKLRRVAGDDA